MIGLLPLVDGCGIDRALIGRDLASRGGASVKIGFMSGHDTGVVPREPKPGRADDGCDDRGRQEDLRDALGPQIGQAEAEQHTDQQGNH